MIRNQQIDTLRSVACLLVIAIHIVAPNISFHNVNNQNFNIDFAIDVISRVSVPLFVMISGRFLLFRETSYKEFYSKKLKRVLIPTVFWSFFYIGVYCAFKIFKGEVIDIGLIFKNLINGKPHYHLWYMYMILGLYLVVPVLNNAFKNLSKNELVRLGIILIIISTINQYYNYVFEIRPFFITWYLDFIGYFLLGYALKEEKSISSLFLIIILLSSYLLNGFISLMYLKQSGTLFLFNYNSPFVVTSSLSFYLLFNKLKINSNIFSRLALISFGVYLVHPLVIEILNIVIKRQFFMKDVLLIVLVYIISNIIVWTLYKNKLFRKLI